MSKSSGQNFLVELRVHRVLWQVQHINDQQIKSLSEPLDCLKIVEGVKSSFFEMLGGGQRICLLKAEKGEMERLPRQCMKKALFAFKMGDLFVRAGWRFIVTRGEPL
ncbi:MULTISPECIES: hypothetical protein [Bartonella]|uniref:hypothetical protein n=1 Tax=Bartonella TaxID=773 RepID=UPI00235E6ED8|nr:MULTISPECIES: hypothetical protein [Bartonella]